MSNDVRKELWLKRLLKRDSNWLDGDIATGSQLNKTVTADFFNERLKVCLELKEDQTYNLPPMGAYQVNDLNTLSNRLKTYVKSANKKFRIYPCFKSILIIETQLCGSIIKQLISGIIQIIITDTKSITKSKNLYFSNNTENIGAYLFCSYTKNKGFYLKNPFSEDKRVIPFHKLKEYLPLYLPLEEVSI